MWIYLNPIVAIHSLAKPHSTSLFLWCFHQKSYHRPQPSPLLDSFTFQILCFCSQLTSSLFCSQFVISSTAPQLNAVQICGNSSKQLLQKYAKIYVNCPCWLRIAFILQCHPNLSWTHKSLHLMFLLWHVFHGCVHYLECGAGDIFVSK